MHRDCCEGRVEGLRSTRRDSTTARPLNAPVTFLLVCPCSVCNEGVASRCALASVLSWRRSSAQNASARSALGGSASCGVVASLHKGLGVPTEPTGTVIKLDSRGCSVPVACDAASCACEVDCEGGVLLVSWLMSRKADGAAWHHRLQRCERSMRNGMWMEVCAWPLG